MLQMDKSWDAIHRCLTDGSLGHLNSKDPLAMCVLGGKDLHRGPHYIASYKTAEEVKRIASALEAVNPALIRARFESIVAHGYEGPADNDDLEYTLAYFEDVPGFYRQAASEGRAVLFAVDQ